MDLVLLQAFKSQRELEEFCFNPYFNGSSTSTVLENGTSFLCNDCFNPYFNGSSTST